VGFLSGAFDQMCDHEKVNAWKSQKILQFELIQINGFAMFTKMLFV